MFELFKLSPDIFTFSHAERKVCKVAEEFSPFSFIFHGQKPSSGSHIKKQHTQN
jgi:hypothetical protein